MGFYSSDINEFAKQVVWYDCAEKNLEDSEAFNDFLVFLLGRGQQAAVEHARTVFKITDDQFAEALKTAKPGIFIYEDKWKKCNDELGINPPMAFPKKKWATD